ncbi:MAG: hypothetical protein ACFBSD_06735 [Paracoccaceae bacterium]
MTDATLNQRDTAADDPADISEDDKIEQRLPDPETLPELIVYSHSPLLYWWPAWVVGYLCAALTYFQGTEVNLDPTGAEIMHPSAGPGIGFTLLLLVLVFFTNIQLRGVYSALVVVSAAFLTVLFAWLGWWDNIASLIPYLSIHMTVGFYLAFATGLLVIWLLSVFVFDRMRFWRIRPGQMTEERVIGGAEESYDTRGMLFEQQADDLFRHVVLGLGTGDLRLTLTGAKEATIRIPNVLFAKRKIARVQKLISVQPDDLMS